MRTTPNIFIPLNPSGGTRRSTIMALVAMALQKSGKFPILIDFGSNSTFSNMLPGQEIHHFSCNNLDEDRIRGLLAQAKETGEPVVVDLEAGGGLDFLGRIRRVFADSGRIIGLVPTTAYWSTPGIIEVCSVFQPAALIKVSFGRFPGNPEQQEHDEAVDKLSPDAAIVLDELTAEDARHLTMILWDSTVLSDSTEISALRRDDLTHFLSSSCEKIQTALQLATPLYMVFKSEPDYHPLEIPWPEGVLAPTAPTDADW